MTNPFHLLLAPEAGQSLSRILQSLTVAHTWHYHRSQGTMGHVWQGRFKSPVVQNDAHALVVPRYLEANPLRARMVAELASYPWSSYRAHGKGAPDPLLSPLPGWEGQVGAATAGVLAAMGAHPAVGPRLSCRAPVGGERAALWCASVDSRRGVRLGIASGATAPWPAAETAGKMN